MGGMITPNEAGSIPSAHGGTGGGGMRLNVILKYFAVTGSKEMVCSGARPPLRLTILRKVWPSSLASRFLSGALIPVINSSIKPGSLVT